MARIEQQIYASLAVPGLKAGHHTHASTPGIGDTLRERHEQICNRWGSYRSGVEFRRALIHVTDRPLDSAVQRGADHVIALITYQGKDATGRPGALLRHIVRMDHEAFARIGADPFYLLESGRMLEEWTPDTPLPELASLGPRNDADHLGRIAPSRYPLLRNLVCHFLAEGRLSLHATTDSDDAQAILAELLALLPVDVRRRLSIASFCHEDADGYDLVVEYSSAEDLPDTVLRLRESAAPTLGGDAATYVDRLFDLLDKKWWDQAAELVRRDRTLWAAMMEHAASAPDQGRTRDEPTMEVPVEDTRPAERETARTRPTAPSAGGDLHTPSFRTREQRRPRRSRSPWKALVVLLVVAGLGVAAWANRDRFGPLIETESTPRTVDLSASSLDELVTRHTAHYEAMLVRKQRDFDIKEDLDAQLERFSDRLDLALESERRAMDDDLAEAVGTAEGTLGKVAARMRAAGFHLQSQAPRVAALEALLQSGSPEILHRGFDEDLQKLTLPPATGAAPAGAARVEAWANGLVQAADLVETATEPTKTLPPAGGWAETAAAFTQALQDAPSDLPGRPMLEALASTFQAAQVWTASRDFTGLSARARSWSGRAALGNTADDLVAALATLRDRLGSLPGALGPLDAFLATGDRVRGVNRPARSAVCAADAKAAADPCRTEPYRSALARWRLELEVRGAAVFEAPDLVREGEAERFAGLIRRLRAATTPAPPELVSEAQGLQTRLGESVYREMLRRWISGQQEQVQAGEVEFVSDYGTLLESAQALRTAATEAQAFAAFRAVAAALETLEDYDESQLSRDPEQAGRLRSFQRYRTALLAPHAVELARYSVRLLSTKTYEGDELDITRLVLRIHEIQGGTARRLVELGPEILMSAPIVGFEPLDRAADDDFEFGATSHLLITATDAATGALWFHRHLERTGREHVAQHLVGEHLVRVPPNAEDAPANLAAYPPNASTGREAARLRFTLADRWWQTLVQQLPALRE